MRSPTIERLSVDRSVSLGSPVFRWSALGRKSQLMPCMPSLHSWLYFKISLSAIP